MVVYLTNIILIYIFAAAFLLYNPNEKKKAVYCAIVGLQWTLISGLRGISVGSDTAQYLHRFEVTKTIRWARLFENFWDVLTNSKNLSEAYLKDPGYAIIEKTFQLFSSDYQKFLMLIAIFFTVFLAMWIYKNSTMPCLSFIVYSSLFYTFFSLTGHRQTIATTLVLFLGYKFIKERKLIPYIILAFFAFFIHKSSIIFVPFYFLSQKKITWKYVSFMAALSVALLAFGRRVYGFVVEAIGYGDYEEFDRVPTRYIILIVLLVAISFVFLNKVKKNRPDDYTVFYNAMLYCFLFTLLTIRDQTFMRVQLYFAQFLMLMIPEIVRAFDKRVQVVPYLLASAVFVAKLALSPNTYVFFWQ